MRGPVKLMERAKAKAQNEYVKEAQYADIKLNVVIKGKHNNIIGEVQFLLRAMKEYKDKAHNLYAIQRKEESITTSVSPTLPILMDLQKEIVGVACGGEWKKMCSLMILQNQSIKDVMFLGPTKDSVLAHICCLGKLKMLKFLQSMMSPKQFIDYIFLAGIFGQNCVEYSILKSHPMLVKYLFDLTDVQDQYKNNDELLFRLLVHLFADNRSPHIIDYVLSTLQIDKEKVIEMLTYECPKQTQDDNGFNLGRKYHKRKLITAVIEWGTLKHLQQLIDFIGNKAFVDTMLNIDTLQGWDVMSFALKKKNKNVIEYILKIDGVKEKYMSDNNLLYTLVHFTDQFIESREVLKCIVNSLGLTKTNLNELRAFRAISIDKFLPFIK